jgi:hypothetical protein
MDVTSCRDREPAMADVPGDLRKHLVGGDIDTFEREVRRKSDDRLVELLAPHRSPSVVRI